MLYFTHKKQLLYLTIFLLLFGTMCAVDDADEAIEEAVEAYAQEVEEVAEISLDCSDNLTINFGIGKDEIMISNKAPIAYNLSIKNNRPEIITEITVLFYNDQKLHYVTDSLKIYRNNVETQLSNTWLEDDTFYPITMEPDEEISIRFEASLLTDVVPNEILGIIAQVSEVNGVSCALIAPIHTYDENTTILETIYTRSYEVIGNLDAIRHEIRVKNVGDYASYNTTLKIDLPKSEEEARIFLAAKARISIKSDNLKNNNYSEDRDIPTDKLSTLNTETIYFSLLDSVFVTEGYEVLNINCQEASCQLPINMFWEEINLGTIPSDGEFVLQFTTIINKID